MKKVKDFKWPNKEGKKLSRAILSLNTEKEVENFLRDVCTISELQAMTERYQVAQMLQEGIAYRKIAEKTGVSTTTITRVAHWMRYGKGGYKVALG